MTEHRRRISILTFYWTFRKSSPGAFKYFLLGIRQTALVTLICLAFAVMCYFLEVQSAAFAFAGFGFGVLVRDYGQARSTNQVWPIIRTYIDWEKVESDYQSVCD